MSADRETSLMHRATNVPLTGKQWADQEYRAMLAASHQAHNINDDPDQGDEA